MPDAPQNPRATAFVDGQNLFNAAKEAFGYTFPNYDVVALCREVCSRSGWNLIEMRFYTGVPEPSDPRHAFWANKLASLGRQGVVLFSKPLRYRAEETTLEDGNIHRVRVPSEKGIDVRLALDVIRLAFSNRFDVAVLFSQDQDYAEVAKEIRSMARGTGRWIKVASAYPLAEKSRNKRGIDGTDWIQIDKTAYDRCIDPLDYRART